MPAATHERRLRRLRAFEPSGADVAALDFLSTHPAMDERIALLEAMDLTSNDVTLLGREDWEALIGAAGTLIRDEDAGR